jgi:3-methyladenine DNA glycosylase AlkC
MGAPLKTFFSPALVHRLGAELARVYPPFDRESFVAQASAGLDELELLARGAHLAAAMARHLPQDYPTALGLLMASLGPEHESAELLGLGMAPFFYLPHTHFVAQRGLDHFELSMGANYELTKRFTAEASIRPYLAREPERTLALLHQWVGDANPHVRRLVSEGTRLRLPWASRVPWLDQHPERVVGLLERLKDDPASVVRRSVANSLNDLSKVHPELCYAICGSWLRSAPARRRALVAHALRSAVKRGEAAALQLMGFGEAAAVEVEAARFEPRRVAIGGEVELVVELRSRGTTVQELLVDVAVHFVKAGGKTSPKVFKWARLRLPPGAHRSLRRRLSLAVYSTRVPRPGHHAVELRVNGVVYPLGGFEVDGSAPGVVGATGRSGS